LVEQGGGRILSSNDRPKGEVGRKGEASGKHMFSEKGGLSLWISQCSGLEREKQRPDRKNARFLIQGIPIG